jgi:hypothetical protein
MNLIAARDNLKRSLAANHQSKGFFLPLTILGGSLTQMDGGDTFQCDCGDGKIIQCTVADIALRDLIDFHRIKTTAADASRVLLAEIERLVNAKFDAERFEEGGGLAIQPADIVRYGFERRKKRAA